MPPGGYSSTPLAKKLGFKNGFTIKLINVPLHYHTILALLPGKFVVADDVTIKKDFIHFFTTSRHDLTEQLCALMEELKPAGMIWVSWPKKSSKKPVDFNENDIRNLALSIGLVDIKVCAVDEIWSALKLVIPVKNRMK